MLRWASLTFFLSIFSFALAHSARALDPAIECPTIKDLAAVVHACEAETQTFQCEKFAAKFPEVKKHLRKCDPESICHAEIGSLKALSMWSVGFGENAVDSAKAVGELAWKKGISEPKEALAIAQKCDAMPACKRAAASDVPWRKNLSDEELKSISSLQLSAEALMVEAFEKLKHTTSTALTCLGDPKNSLPSAQDAKQVAEYAAAKLDALADWSAEQTVLTTFRVYCADPAGQAEIVGYTTAYFIDPLAVAGALAKSRYLIEVLQMAKTPEAVERVAHAPLIGGKVKDRGEVHAGLPAPLRDATRAEARDSFVATHAARVFSTPEENERFVKLATNARPGGGVLFVQSENTYMKTLNDSTKDKNLVTALTNYRKEIERDGLKDLQSRNPGLEITTYSDFKTEKFALTGHVPADIHEQLKKFWDTANEKYQTELVATGILRKTDTPKFWFRAGAADTEGVANIYARQARRQGELRNDIVTESLSPELKQQMKEKYDTVRALQNEAVGLVDGGHPKLFTTSPKGNRVLSDQTLDLVRKYKDEKSLQGAIKKEYGASLDPKQVASIRNYAAATDEFQPSIHVIKRELPSLEKAEHGGFSVDFLGMGSANHHAVGAALADSEDFHDAIVKTREAEIGVTKVFHERMAKLKEIAGDYVHCTGDDCVGIAPKPMTEHDKITLLNRLASDDLTRSIRLSFVAPKTNVIARDTVATHGEAIEKGLRTSLRGKIPTDKLKLSLFAVDMRTTEVNQGRVELLVGTKPGVVWKPEEWRQIEMAFDDAVKNHNANLAVDAERGHYVPAKTRCATVDGGLVCTLQNATP